MEMSQVALELRAPPRRSTRFPFPLGRAWFRRAIRVLQVDSEMTLQTWLSDIFGDLLAKPETVPRLMQQVRQALTALIQQAGEDEVATTARLIDIASRGPSVNAVEMPYVAVLLHLCFALGYHFSDLQTLDPKTLCSLIWGEKYVVYPRKRRGISPEKRGVLRQALDDALERKEYPPVPLAVIVRTLGVSQYEVYKANPPCLSGYLSTVISPIGSSTQNNNAEISERRPDALCSNFGPKVSLPVWGV